MSHTGGHTGSGSARSPRRRDPLRSTTTLLEREQEKEALVWGLERLRRSQPTVFTVEGEPGAGQNALLRWAEECGHARGVRVLYAQATPVEQDLPLGAVLQLLAPLSDLPGMPAPPSAPRRRTGVPPGLAALLRSALRTPTLLLVQDAQWLDRASRQWLQALVRRLSSDMPTALAVSSSHPCAGWSWLTAGSLPAVPVRQLVAQPLSARAVGVMVRQVCGTRGDESFHRAVADATRGNPSVLREALRRFHHRGHRPVHARLSDFAALADDIVAERAVRGLEVLPAEGRAVLHALAVCGHVLDFSLARTLAGPREAPDAELLAMLRAVGLIDVRGEAAYLRNPAARIRVLEQLTAHERGELHVLAAALAHRAAAPDTGIAEILLRAPAIGARWVVETLHRSCTEALAADDLDHLVACLSRLLHEPLKPPERARVTLRLAGAEMVRTPHVADRRLENLVRNDSGWAAAARVRAIDLGLARGNEDWAARAAAEALPSAAEHTGRDLIALHWLAHRDRQDEADLMLPVVPALPEQPATPTQAGVLAWCRTVRAEDASVVRTLARHCLGPTRGPGTPVMPRLAACRALLAADDLEAAHAAVDTLLREVRRAHTRAAEARLLTLRAEIRLRGGRLEAARRDVHAARGALPIDSWHPVTAPELAAVSIEVAVESGDQELADLLAKAERLPDEAAGGVAWCRLLFARAHVASLNGQWTEALTLARECGRWLRRHAWLNPALLPWRSLAARCLDMLGHPAQAEELARTEADRARGWGTATAVGLCAVTAGALTGEAALDRLQEAARTFDGSQERLRHAWSLVQLAESEARSGDHLAAARLVARLTRLTTTYPSSRLAEAVRRVSGELERPALPAVTPLSSASDVLTETERETALLALRGHGNGEIADLLSVSRRTVELRLSSVYKKLRITGRRELHRLGETTERFPTDAA